MIIDTGNLGPIRVEPDKRARNAKLVRDVFKHLAETTTNPRTMTAGSLSIRAASDADLDVVFRSIAI
jgi:hypothetical protein